MNSLNEEQLDFFRTNGYLILKNVFKAAEVRRMQEESDYLLALIINSSLAHQRRSGRLDWRKNSTGEQIVRKLQPINDLSLTFTRLSEDERLVGPLRDIMGEDPILMEEKLNYKQPLPSPVEGLDIRTMDDYFPIHNDWAYYAEQKYPQSVLSSALLLDDCTTSNGPLRVWPGSHLEHRAHESMENGLQVKPGLIDYDGGEDMLAPAGSFMIFHVLAVHNSRPNTSGRPRRIMIYSHYPKSFNMPWDARNGRNRLRESPWEREYMRMKERGDYTDTFHAPVYA
ncbi:MAG: phytanoyl-CoA dioxygenase family protein [Verrucomicrobia bacterium]|nr:phytanoyl-CoA dioxygenase family protein [Verrucomicrobiota bacterium]MDA1088641.1 phytanoyl-CoA dioxygenase family protein [Verrucomicrobiota bacterium]